jgi:methyl-accepting chemotaxis protein
MDLDRAIQAHDDWKSKLAHAIEYHETLDAGTISRDDCCDFGKWIHGEAKAPFGGYSSYATCVNKHAAFHAAAGKVAAAVNAKQFDEATAMLGGGTAFDKASVETRAAIASLKSAIG